MRSLALFLVFALTLAAGADPPQFNVGDRVEVDINMNSDPATGNWKPGVIKQVDLANGGYWVELDGSPGQANWKIIPIRTDKWTRAASGAAPAAPAASAPQAAPTAQTAAASGQPAPVKPGGDVIEAHKGPHKPTVEHVKSMIYEDMKFKYETDWDYVEITFSDLSVGSPYVEPAETQQKRNSLAYSRRLGVPVHPVKTKFQVLVRSNLGTEHVYAYDSQYIWYIDTRGECQITKQGKPIDYVQVR